MKYRYLYQTKTNENREGEISAKNRAEAYAALRKQGIRPFRLIGNDPVRWQPWAVGAAFVALCVALAFAIVLVVRGRGGEEFARGQLAGDADEITEGVVDGWSAVFSSPLDLYLAAYAQPGWIALPPETSESDIAGFAAELERPAVAATESDSAVVRQMKGIVATMRAEMRRYLEAGGTAEGYLEFIESRQNDEIAFRREAEQTVRKAPDSLRETARINMNMRLQAQGLRTIQAAP